MSDFNGILIATDLDGTFVSSRGAIVERNLKAIAVSYTHLFG